MEACWAPGRGSLVAVRTEAIELLMMDTEGIRGGATPFSLDLASRHWPAAVQRKLPVEEQTSQSRATQFGVVWSTQVHRI